MTESNPFLDLGELSEVVVIRGKNVPVYGICSEDLRDIFIKFPTLLSFIDRAQVVEARKGNIGPKLVQDLLRVAPEALSEIVVYAVGLGSAETTEEQKAAGLKKARRMAIGDLVKVISKCFRITFPEGVGPFLDEMKGFTAAMKVGAQTPQQTSETETETLPSGIPVEEITDALKDGMVYVDPSPNSLSGALVGELPPSVGRLRRVS